jgi:hypothetical protein
MIVKIFHPELGPQRTYISTDVSADATSATVENNTGFGTNDYVVMGNPGDEKTEIVLLTSTTGSTTIGFTGKCVFAHQARTQVAEIKYNQAEIYTSTSQTGTYALLATVSLTLDEKTTIYDDTTGASTTWYKIRYKNVVGSIYSDYSDPVQGTGYTDDSLYSMTEEVLEEFGDSDSAEISRTRIKRLIKGGVRKTMIEIIKTYPDYHRNYTTQVLTNGTATYDLPTRFLAFFRVDINYSGSSAADAYKADFESESEHEPDVTYSKEEPQLSFRANQFVIKPTPDSSSGYAFMWYWDYPAVIDSDADEHGMPYGTRDVLVAYVLWKLWIGKDNDKAKMYKTEYKDSLDTVIDFIGQGRQNYTPKRVKVVYGSDIYEE